MRLLCFRALALIALAFVASPSAAQVVTPPSYVFDTIDTYALLRTDYTNARPNVSVSGVLHGQTAATTVALAFYSDQTQAGCIQQIIQMMNRPGRFSLTIVGGYDYSFYGVTQCSLAKQP
jgi:hypothetical protein